MRLLATAQGVCVDCFKVAGRRCWLHALPYSSRELIQPLEIGTRKIQARLAERVRRLTPAECRAYEAEIRARPAYGLRAPATTRRPFRLGRAA